MQRGLRLVVLVCALISLLTAPAHAISLTPSSPVNAAVASYDLLLTASSSTLIRCIEIEFDTAHDGSGGVPAGMNIAATTLDAADSDFVGGIGSWNVSVSSASGLITVVNASGSSPSSGSRHIVLDGIVNPSASASYHALVRTFTNVSCSSGGVDSMTVPFVITGAVSIGVVVDAFMTFSVAGRSAACNGQAPTSFSTASTPNEVILGHIDKTVTGGGAQDLAISTNAGNGFAIYVRAPGAPNAMNDGGGHVIADVTGTRAQPGPAPVAGTEAFGYTADDPVVGTGINKFVKLTAIDEAVMTANAGTISRTNCVGYEASASESTHAGGYVALVEYTAVAFF